MARQKNSENTARAASKEGSNLKADVCVFYVAFLRTCETFSELWFTDSVLDQDENLSVTERFRCEEQGSRFSRTERDRQACGPDSDLHSRRRTLCPAWARAVRYQPANHRPASLHLTYCLLSLSLAKHTVLWKALGTWCFLCEKAYEHFVSFMAQASHYCRRTMGSLPSAKEFMRVLVIRWFSVSSLIGV